MFKFKTFLVFWLAVVATIFVLDYLIRMDQGKRSESSKTGPFLIKCIKEKNAAPSKP